MSFGLTNAPTTFCNFMNDVLFEFIDAFVVVYLNDIVVYNQSLQEHEKHLSLVFQKLRENRLYVKKEKKCEFAHILGHKISAGLIRMDENKIRVIREWLEPSKLKEMLSFLRFIKGYSKLVELFIDLLKKDQKLE